MHFLKQKGKGNNDEDIEGDSMEKFNLLSYFKLRKNARNAGKKKILQEGGNFCFNFLKCVRKLQYNFNGKYCTQ